MIHRPKPSLLHLAGHLLKLFVIWVFAFTFNTVFSNAFRGPAARRFADCLCRPNSPEIRRYYSCSD